ncbi:TauD/TfdA family dioxygenase [Roseomonas sp. OT10]|uniref:TauD/TfdA dioxygenase family protein n=1 Tax=Roseomonas cutis TaxID=2897332 RepID=UPI001E39A497|nr:TauD/TfdA family dioxygenase [Roseomonas sp. OT10]UFN48945.1 TauD/TfdA family dioxygenase [Roseomonas sp. OT10]
MSTNLAEARTGSGAHVQPTGGGLGADILGVDVANPGEADMAIIRQALLDHLVIRIRGTAIDDPAFERFGARFGELLPSPDFTRSRPTYLRDAPNVTVISNVTEDGKPIGEHGDGELHWHTDLAFTDTPSALTMLLAREVPPTGGNTSFTNMYAALEAVPQDLRARLTRLRLKHQASHNAQGGKRPGYQDIETDDVREMPGPQHPIIRTHPESGRQALYLGRRFGSYIPGLPLAKSEALVEELWSYAVQPGHTWAQEWRVGDLVIWDNRCTMHRRDAFTGLGRRRMHRLTTRGERPV